MKVLIQGSVLGEALSIVTSLAPPMNGNVILVAKDGKLSMLSIGELNRCELRLPCRVKGDDIFAIPIVSLNAATAKREDLRLNFENDVLTIHSGKYKTVLPTVDVLHEEAGATPDLTFYHVDETQAEWIRDALHDTALKPTALLDSILPTVIRISPDGAFVCCYDMTHFAFMENSDLVGNLMEITAPSGTLATVFNTFGNTAFDIATSNGVLYVRNPVGIATISLISAKFTLPTEQHFATINNLRATNFGKLKVDSKEILQWMANAKAVAYQGTRNNLVISAESDEATLSINTASGSSEITVPAKVSSPFKIEIDFDYFAEFLGKNPDVILVNDRLIFFDSPEFGMVVGLNQQG